MTTWFISAYDACECVDLRELRGLIPRICGCHPTSHMAGNEIGVELVDPDPAALGHRCEPQEEA